MSSKDDKNMGPKIWGPLIWKCINDSATWRRTKIIYFPEVKGNNKDNPN